MTHASQGREPDPARRIAAPRALRARLGRVLELGGGWSAEDKRAWAIMIGASVLLTLFYYYGRVGFWRRSVAPLIGRWLDLLEPSWRPLGGYAYWASASVVLRVVAPALLCAFLYRQGPRHFGMRAPARGHAKYYAALYFVMLPLLVAASFLPSFQKKYPFWKGATESVWHFLTYEIFYGTQFFALEAFFRGFILFALFKRFGHHAILIMTIPYCMIHFNKPVPETLGAIVAGIVLGSMALASRSWLPGAMLHWGIGATMDLLCIWHRGGFRVEP